MFLSITKTCAPAGLENLNASPAQQDKRRRDATVAESGKLPNLPDRTTRMPCWQRTPASASCKRSTRTRG